MRWAAGLLACAMLLPASGCGAFLVRDPDRMQVGGRFEIETSGILDYVAGLKLRIFGGIVIEREVEDEEREGGSIDDLSPAELLNLAE